MKIIPTTKIVKAPNATAISVTIFPIPNGGNITTFSDLILSTSVGVVVGSWLPCTEYAILLPTLLEIVVISAMLLYVLSSEVFSGVINCVNTSPFVVDSPGFNSLFNPSVLDILWAKVL